MSASIDLTLIPGNPPSAAVAGDTWNFQAWHRDAVGGSATSNFTEDCVQLVRRGGARIVG